MNSTDPDAPAAGAGKPPGSYHVVERLAHAVYGLILLTAGVQELRLHEDARTAIALIAGGALVLVIAHSYSQFVAVTATEESLPSRSAAVANLLDQLALAVSAAVAIAILALAEAGALSTDTAYNVVLAAALTALFALGLAIGYHHSRRLSLGLAIGIANLAVGVIVISVEAAAAH
jgi:hypothetical protein